MESPCTLSLLKKRKKFFLAILDLTKTEASLSSEQLPCVLKQKKTLLACVKRIDAQIKQNCPIFPNPLPDAMHQEMELTRSIIQKILDIDKKNYLQRQIELKTYEN